MSQVTEQSVRFQTALASIKLIQASAVLDLTEDDFDFLDRKSGSAGMPRPISYAVFCLKKKNTGERLYLEGDFGRWRPEGKLEYLGLRESHVKIVGFRIQI